MAIGVGIRPDPADGRLRHVVSNADRFTPRAAIAKRREGVHAGASEL
jgi:hypothetical protein